jgi:two-component system CheB/CheR fusion protein
MKIKGANLQLLKINKTHKIQGRAVRTQNRQCLERIETMGKQAGQSSKRPEQAKSLKGETSPPMTGKSSVKGKFPIVGIGASAGGLEALEQFLGNVPQNSGMAFVVIQHLDPTHKGIMPELLQRITKMEVIRVKDRLKVKPNCVYVIPPNTSMSILNGALHLFEPLETRGLRLPIDFFFRSLADDQQERSIGIVLSGMGSDGTLGLLAIKEKSGIVLVQDPASAKFDAMPRSAIDTVLVDIVASAGELPSKLIACLQHTAIDKPKPVLEIKDKSALEKIIILLRADTGHDFSMYKKNTVYRRVERRMGIHQINKIADYVHFLQENPKELSILFKELLIGVTSFFRDPKVWEHLKEKALPAMLANLPHGHELRAWVPGCSTGEEAYSLAIIFKEALESVRPQTNISLQIFATDIDTDAIEKARKGIYRDNIASDVSPNRLSRFFTKTEDGYRVNAEIREMIIFAPQNVTKDPPFTKMDIISCRNLLIYMEGELQKKLLSLFSYSLNSGGILLLGTAETIGDMTKVLTPVDAKSRIYRRSASVAMDELVDFPSAFSKAKSNFNEKPRPMKTTQNIQTLADQLVLQQFAPATVLVNNKGDILYITGHTGNYLEPPAGKSNWNIFAMAREGMRNELPLAFRKALQQKEPVTLHNIKVGANGGTQTVNITIQLVEKPDVLRGMVIVIFTDVPMTAETKLLKTKKGKTLSHSRLAEMELQLQQARENLKSAQEEMQTSQEELKSTNEELQSANEELQSTNEELTTSKEEMQSLNEELQTVNIELQSKVDDYSRVNSDMKNLLNSTDIATLFLDKELCISRFTSQATKIFKLIPSDIGRPFTDLVTDLVYPELSDDAREVLRTLVFLEKDITTRDRRWFRVRIMPYRTLDDRIDGLVVTFVEITTFKTLEAALQETGKMLRLLINSTASVIIGISPDGKILEFNPEAERLFGQKRDDVMGKNYFDLFIPAPSRKKVQADLQKMLAGSLPGWFETPVQSSNGNSFPIRYLANKLVNGEGKAANIIIIGQKKAEA